SNIALTIFESKENLEHVNLVAPLSIENRDEKHYVYFVLSHKLVKEAKLIITYEGCDKEFILELSNYP
ncbi:hypothetical protein QE250_16915, partial [Chromatiaceae bacterium AAb-1]|nr:hypothetical protein [Chromatiaceae bacterium AAb-1]